MKKLINREVSKTIVDNKIVKQKSISRDIILINLLEKTQIFSIKHFLFIKGPRGIVLYSSLKESLKYNIILEKKSLAITRKPSICENHIRILKADNLKLFHLIQELMAGVHFFFSKKLLLVGIGLRAWIKTLKNKEKILLIKVGFSEDLCIKIPASILVFTLRSNLILIRGLSKDGVHQFASFIRSHKKPKPYKGIGIQYNEETFILKTGKKN